MLRIKFKKRWVSAARSKDTVQQNVPTSEGCDDQIAFPWRPDIEFCVDLYQSFQALGHQRKLIVVREEVPQHVQKNWQKGPPFGRFQFHAGLCFCPLPPNHVEREGRKRRLDLQCS